MRVFDPLRAELDTWEAEGLRLPFWWRDDDAVAMTPALGQLLELAERVEMPLHLAVIPGRVQAGLAAGLEGTRARVLTHGWVHANHAPSTEKKAEFRDHRALDVMRGELEQGFGLMAEGFGGRFVPVFVPPWNRVSAGVTGMLPGIGYKAVSVFNARRDAFEINTHVDPIDWRGSRSCVAVEALVAQVGELLVARRLGAADNSEPLGLLTHHLVHDPAIWEFTAAFLEVMRAGPVERVALDAI